MAKGHLVTPPNLVGFALKPGIFGHSRTVFYAMDEKGNIWKREEGSDVWYIGLTVNTEFRVDNGKASVDIEELALLGVTPKQTKNK